MILAFFFVGPGAAQRRRRPGIFSDPMDFKVFMQTPRLSPDRGEQKGAKKERSSFSRPRAKKNDHFLPNIFKVDNDPQALGRILVDFWLFGQTGSFFLYPRVPPCRANFLNIRPRIKFLYTKWIEIENNGEKHLRINSSPSRLASGDHFPSVLMIFKTAVSFNNTLQSRGSTHLVLKSLFWVIKVKSKQNVIILSRSY